MYRFLSDATNLKAVFSSYTTLEALNVKGVIEQVVQQLKIPSKALLEHMEQEGIVLSDVAPTAPGDENWTALSETVIRSHLRATFVSHNKLYAALSALSLAQQVEIRDLLDVVSSYLRLPSDTLLRRMQDEGLTLDKLGVTVPVADKVAQVRQKLNALSQQVGAESTAVPASLAPADIDALSSLKQRISELKKPNDSAERCIQLAGNVVSLTDVTGKLKVSMS